MGPPATEGSSRSSAWAAPVRRAANTVAGSANDQASGMDRSTIWGWKLKNVAATVDGPTAPTGADPGGEVPHPEAPEPGGPQRPRGSGAK